MKKIIYLLTLAASILSASAQQTASQPTPWCVDLNLKPGLLSQGIKQPDLSKRYPDAVNDHIGTIKSTGGTTFGFDVQVGYFFDKQGHYGVGTGFMYLNQSNDLTFDPFHIEYRSTDYNGNAFRQVLTANQAVKEEIKTTNINIPLVFKYKTAINAKWGVAADVGLLLNLKASNSYTTNASFDYEAIYKLDENSVPVYDPASVPDPNDWLVTKAQYQNKNPDGNVNAYFNDLHSKGYNVGLGVKPTQNSGTTSYKSGSIGFMFQPSVTYKLNDQFSLNAGVYYIVQKFENTNTSARLTDKVGDYSSLTNSISSVTNHAYGVNIGVRYSFGIVKDKDHDGISDHKDNCPDLAGLATMNGCPDSDKDGIADKDDSCPQVAGTLHGCPDTDNDGIADGEDACPNEAGTVSLKGCPDRDGDGIADHEDSCPDKAGVIAFKGCPDSDGDGIADTEDQCPDQKGTLATNGCPDTDGDGVKDQLDSCVTVAGLASNNGCPEVKQEVQQLFEKALQGIEFEPGKAVLKGSSSKILDAIVKMMKENPTYKLMIEGHTDKMGKDEANLKLSAERADAVGKYMIKKGVPASRISTKGYGSTMPVDSNDTEKGRARNRRVELKIEYMK